MGNNQVTQSHRIDRLSRLIGTDPGFYVLALHSFVESHIREHYPDLRYVEPFGELLWSFGDELKREGATGTDDLRTLNRIGKEHALTNEVRHRFREIDIDEARGSKR